MTSGTRSTICESVALEADELARIVGHHPDRGEPEVAEDLRADAVVPEVGREAEPLVGLHRVGARVLQRVGAELVEQPDAPALLVEIDDRRRGPPRAISSMARCSWGPQSQRCEPNTSPVRHFECIRTSTSGWPATSP